MGRALRDFALPLVLLTIALNLAVGLLVGDLGRIAYLGSRAVRWVSSFVLTNLALLASCRPSWGRSFRRAAAAYGLPTPTRPPTRPRPARATCPSCWPAATWPRPCWSPATPTSRASCACPGTGWRPTPAAGSVGLVPVRAWLALRRCSSPPTR